MRGLASRGERRHRRSLAFLLAFSASALVALLIGSSSAFAALTPLPEPSGPDPCATGNQADVPAGMTLVMGTPNADTINGTAADEYICGLGGDDTIDAGPGNDVIDGGPGADTINGDVGLDTLTYKYRTADVKVALNLVSSYCNGNGEDKSVPDGNPLPCQPGPNQGDGDRLQLGGVENVIGGAGNDVLTGDIRDNSIDGGPGADQISGGHGVDTVDYSTRTENVDVTLGDKHDGVDVVSPLNNDGSSLDGPAGARDNVSVDVENVIGGAGDDFLTGSDPINPDAPPSDFPPPSPEPQTGANVLIGGPGNDTFDGGFGADTFVGDGGDEDTVTYEDRTTPVSATIDGVGNDGGAEDTERQSGRQDFIGSDIENLVGGSGDDFLKGSDANNVLDGGTGGADFIQGGGGDDVLAGFDGNDVLEGGDGVDALTGGNGSDQLDGGPGNDSLDGEAGDDTLAGGAGADQIAGGDGSDIVDYSGATSPVNVTPDDVPNDGLYDVDGNANNGAQPEGDNVASDVEGAIGGSDGDTLSSNSAGGLLDGRGGDDVLTGGPGPDTFTGGSGFDAVTYAARSASVSVNLSVPGGDGQAGENDNITSDVESVVGGSGNDTLIGNAAANDLFGGPGNDSLTGGDGFDLLHGDQGNDTLNGGNDRDILNGDDGNDSLSGGAGDDTLAGGAGDDALDGGLGTDTLNGGGGSDTAMYSTRAKSVFVTLNGSPTNGERGEGDLITDDVPNVKTGSGDDKIDSRDGVAGNVSCGAGADTVMADKTDNVSSDCENKNVTAAGRCHIGTGSVRMSRKGLVRVRVRCPFNAKGTLKLRKGKRALGNKRFSAKAGKSKTVRVKLNRKSRRLVVHRKSLRAKATVTARPRGAAASSRLSSSHTIRIKAPSHKRGKK